MKVLAFFLGILSVIMFLIAVVGVIVQLRNPTVSYPAITVGFFVYGGLAFFFYWAASKLYTKAHERSIKP